MKKICPYSPWECSRRLFLEYTKRTLGYLELTCYRQIARLVKQHARRNDSLLDAGCGMGSFYLSLRKLRVPVRYYGIDKSSLFIETGRHILKKERLDPSRLRVGDFMDTFVSYDHVVCINTLCYLPHYHQYLDHLCRIAEKTITIRTSLGRRTTIRYLKDVCLDRTYDEVMINLNTYSLKEIADFIRERGFRVRVIKDEYTQNRGETVAGIKLFRKILLGIRE
jgi:ubiquinone/menaquinone biosynthesis C-methylase UbiE